MAAVVDKEMCTSCGSCVYGCPVEAIKLGKMFADINDDCIECGACVDTCSFGAISM